ncbi:ArsO family NAD(P)H-dependent flavin-containing monooxygenase [Acinetobacter sp. ANC 4635]|uniref:ArsO family NAD(P)H-dependent flavin-containing monooxygenase n=1 Tax=Acinetobacter sp. ANC 4635 TaxID=2529846 RepID=UPI00103B6F8A|nr:ArsO family NAD(P)H-dependent flavin-containing monooxygenase [Acinetobacter sp. ANC 4635]TCB24440.1 NAD(P)/FAD-dependent oxidoreductase [Acinetobacter sp. ANC 4635]
MQNTVTEVDVIIIGGGQSALATAYFLKRSGLSFIILDEQQHAGGAWLHTWDSLRLFSPNSWSSLPGWVMPSTEQTYPTRKEVIEYLQQYEQRYHFPIIRPVHVDHVNSEAEGFRVHAGERSWKAKAVVSTTGTWSHPYIPSYPSQENFKGLQLHSAHYQNAEHFKNKNVMIVGGGNSGAQILAEVSQVANTLWITPTPPQFLADDVDGRILFLRATERLKAHLEGRTVDQPIGGLGDIVMIDSVKDARARGVLHSKPPFSAFTENGVIWEDGSSQQIDAVIWCTGFKAALDHLKPLKIIEQNNTIQVEGTRSIKQPNLWLVGYGEWTGPGSATLVGVSRTARATAEEITEFLN